MRMLPTRTVIAVACTAALYGSGAMATASLGGVAALVGGSGTCNLNRIVPLATSQDTFVLGAATACGGGSASVDLHGEAATGTVGLRAASAGNGFGSSQAAAQVALTDHWLLSAPAGLAIGTYTIPVSLRLEGTVSSAALSGFDRFISYSLSIRDLYGGLSPSSLVSASGSVAARGNFSQTFNGSVDFRYFGPGSALPMTAEVQASLSVPGLNEGLIDFYNTASISMTLPPGFAATTSSGLPLVFAPVPEPATYAMMLAGLGAVGWMSRRRPARAA